MKKRGSIIIIVIAVFVLLVYHTEISPTAKVVLQTSTPEPAGTGLLDMPYEIFFPAEDYIVIPEQNEEGYYLRNIAFAFRGLPMNLIDRTYETKVSYSLDGGLHRSPAHVSGGPMLPVLRGEEGVISFYLTNVAALPRYGPIEIDVKQRNKITGEYMELARIICIRACTQQFAPEPQGGGSSVPEEMKYSDEPLESLTETTESPSGDNPFILSSTGAATSITGRQIDDSSVRCQFNHITGKCEGPCGDPTQPYCPPEPNGCAWMPGGPHTGPPQHDEETDIGYPPVCEPVCQCNSPPACNNAPANGCGIGICPQGLTCGSGTPTCTCQPPITPDDPREYYMHIYVPPDGTPTPKHDLESVVPRELCGFDKIFITPKVQGSAFTEDIKILLRNPLTHSLVYAGPYSPPLPRIPYPTIINRNGAKTGIPSDIGIAGMMGVPPYFPYHIGQANSFNVVGHVDPRTNSADPCISEQKTESTVIANEFKDGTWRYIWLDADKSSALAETGVVKAAVFLKREPDGKITDRIVGCCPANGPNYIDDDYEINKGAKFIKQVDLINKIPDRLGNFKDEVKSVFRRYGRDDALYLIMEDSPTVLEPFYYPPSQAIPPPENRIVKKEDLFITRMWGNLGGWECGFKIKHCLVIGAAPSNPERAITLAPPVAHPCPLIPAAGLYPPGMTDIKCERLGPDGKKI